jgi:hypothetical protein
MPEQVKEVHRLSSEAYAQLTKLVPTIAVTNDTATLQAGYQLGIQLVLQKLREGFVVG